MSLILINLQFYQTTYTVLFKHRCSIICFLMFYNIFILSALPLLLYYFIFVLFYLLCLYLKQLIKASVFLTSKFIMFKSLKYLNIAKIVLILNQKLNNKILLFLLLVYWFHILLFKLLNSSLFPLVQYNVYHNILYFMFIVVLWNIFGFFFFLCSNFVFLKSNSSLKQ